MTISSMFFSIILIILSTVQIDATNHRSIRQTVNNNCPPPEINLCDYISCGNGTCIQNSSFADCYRCNCNFGFTGQLCDLEVTGQVICSPPCQNGGTCTISGGSQKCDCAPGWTGIDCQTRNVTNSCMPNPCGAHGTCIEYNGPTGILIFCNCQDRWTGKFCDINLDVNCPVGYCLSGGTCQMNGAMPYCDCPPTHTGQRCETLITSQITTTTTMTTTVTGMTITATISTVIPVIGSCSSNPCLNGGRCFGTGNSFICVCSQQWSGPTCSKPNSMTTTSFTTTIGGNACIPNPCENGGSCYRHSNDFVCACTQQYTGRTCTVPKTVTTTVPNSTITCANQPCLNGGSCFNTGNSYFCYCGTASPFTGKNCDVHISTIPANCSLNCAPGMCISTGSVQQPFACVCDGILNPTSCQLK